MTWHEHDKPACDMLAQWQPGATAAGLEARQGTGHGPQRGAMAPRRRPAGRRGQRDEWWASLLINRAIQTLGTNLAEKGLTYVWRPLLP